ncbi:hypothetical protein CCYA_CCYA04G1214 [Cyanidiococcus yangmingshanensis]|nr:hypothetical protein CCYA_CCYA04G1214 [Cyanidiococcus yangmingshanensis]
MSLSLRIVFPEGSFTFIRGFTTTSLVKEILERLQSIEPGRTKGQLWFQGRVLDPAHTLADEGITSGVSLNWVPGTGIEKDQVTCASDTVEELRRKAFLSLVPIQTQLAELATQELTRGELGAHVRLAQLETSDELQESSGVEKRTIESTKEAEQLVRAGLAELQHLIEAVSNIPVRSLGADPEARWLLERCALASRWFSDMLLGVSAIASAENAAEKPETTAVIGCTSKLRSMLQRFDTEAKGTCSLLLHDTTTKGDPKSVSMTPAVAAAARSERPFSRATATSSIMSSTLGSAAGTAATRKTTLRAQSTSMMSVPKRAAAPAIIRSAPCFDARAEALLGEKETHKWRTLLARDMRYRPPPGSETLSPTYLGTGRKSVGL